MSDIVKNNCKKKFKNVNNNAFNFNVGDKILLNPKFLISGNNIISNKIKKGKILFRFPCIIEKVLEGGYYDIKFCVDYTPYDIKKNNIYKVNQDMF